MAKNPWMAHVSKVAKENPDLAFKHVLKKAKKTYKAKRGGQDSTAAPTTVGGRHHRKTAKKAGKSRKAKRGGGIADAASPF